MCACEMTRCWSSQELGKTFKQETRIIRIFLNYPSKADKKGGISQKQKNEKMKDNQR